MLVGKRNDCTKGWEWDEAGPTRVFRHNGVIRYKYLGTSNIFYSTTISNCCQAYSKADSQKRLTHLRDTRMS